MWDSSIEICKTVLAGSVATVTNESLTGWVHLSLSQSLSLLSHSTHTLLNIRRPPYQYRWGRKQNIPVSILCISAEITQQAHNVIITLHSVTPF